MVQVQEGEQKEQLAISCSFCRIYRYVDSSLLQSEYLSYFFDVIEFFPSKIFYAVFGYGCSAEMSVRCCALIDRISELEALFDRVGAKVENIVYLSSYLRVGKTDFCRAVCVDEETQRLGYTYGIRYLYEYLVGNTCRYHIFGYMTCSVCGTSIHFRWVFAAECPAAVGSLTAVGVYNYFSARKSCVAVRTPDDELTCRIDV